MGKMKTLKIIACVGGILTSVVELVYTIKEDPEKIEKKQWWRF